MGCCSKKALGFLLILVIIAEAYLLWWIRTEAPAGLIGWVETADASPYYGENAPDPPYTLSLEDRQALIDLAAESHALSGVQDDFATIVALRNLVRESCPLLEKGPDTNDPSELIGHFAQGRGGYCGAIAAVYCATLMAHGYRARLVELVRDSNDIPIWNEGPLDTHVEVEVFSPDHRKWIVSDPTFNCWFHRPGSTEPLSARELQLIAHDPGIDFSQTGWISLADAGAVVAEYDGYSTQPTVESYFIDPVQLFRNVFLLYYDVYSDRPDDPYQKYSQLLTARFLGTEKVIRLLAPNQKRSSIVYYQTTANWLPLVALALLVLLLIPSPPAPVEEEDEDEEDEDLY